MNKYGSYKILKKKLKEKKSSNFLLCSRVPKFTPVLSQKSKKNVFFFFLNFLTKQVTVPNFSSLSFVMNMKANTTFEIVARTWDKNEMRPK
jgi:hypothetical protein